MIREESAGTAEIRREDLAYQSGWEDGRFGTPEVFVANANLAARRGRKVTGLSCERGSRIAERSLYILISPYL